MSLHEVYRLAHTAECRLNISASRPDRNLRVVVGHLMHYESLRLRIVEIEHDIGKAHRASQAGAEDRASTPAGRVHKTSPPPEVRPDSDSSDEDMAEDEVDTDGALGLTRFPSGSHPPALMPDEDEDDDSTEPVSPEEPDDSIVDRVLKRPADQDLTQQIERVRNCPCHGRTDSPQFEKVWELPATPTDKPGVTRAIAQVAD